MPLSKEFLINNGVCCGCKCKNCPYTPKWICGSKEIADERRKGKTTNDEVGE